MCRILIALGGLATALLAALPASGQLRNVEFDKIENVKDLGV